MKAYWVKGSKHSVDAMKAYKEIERIREKNGGSLVAANILEAAKNKKNPLHPEFEWDDSEAATQFRLTQARSLLRSLEVVYEELPNTPLRAYEVVTQAAVRDEPERKVYEPLSVIMADADKRGELLGRAIRDALTFRKKYHDLSELTKVFAELDAFLMSKQAI